MHTEEVVRILPWKYNTYTVGGCRILAHALAPLLEGDVYTVRNEYGPQHYMVHKDGHLFDALGVWDEKGIIKEFYDVEGKICWIVKQEMRSGIPTDKSIEKKLQDYLIKKLFI